MEHQTITEQPRSKAVSREHIEVTPGVCGGKPRIAGHRISVVYPYTQIK
jgi:uncharacterized protein (DUF433 family)